ncbi:hypothetical protein MNV84_07987 [Leishmania braziliensis]|nr:hypothetical protein MNV84_07987 [Leishmania braziliensis]
MRITTATVTFPIGARGAEARKRSATTIGTVSRANVRRCPQPKLIFTPSGTVVRAVSGCEFSTSTTEGAIDTNGSIDSRSVAASVLPISVAPSSDNAHVPVRSISACAVLENQIVSNDTLEATRRSGAAGFPSSGKKDICSCKIPPATTNDPMTNILNTCFTAEAPLGVVGDSRAAAFEGVRANSPFVSSSSSSSDAISALQSKVSHAAERSSATHRSSNGVVAERPQLHPSLTQDNRSFLNPGYSSDPSEWNSNDGGDSSRHAGSDDSAGGSMHQHGPSAAPSRRTAPAAVPSVQGRGSCTSTPPPVVATTSSGDENQTTLTFSLPTAAEEQATWQTYDTYSAQRPKRSHHRSHPSAIKHRSQSPAPASPAVLSTSTSVGGREVLQLLPRLYQRAQAIVASTIKTATPTPALPQTKAVSSTMTTKRKDTLGEFPSTEYLLDAAQACFGARRFRALMAAVTTDGDTLVPTVVQNNGRGAPTISTASRSRLSSSSSQGLTIEEALSFLSRLKYALASDVPTQGNRKQAEPPAKLEVVTGGKEPDRPAKAASSQPPLGLHALRKTRSVSAPKSQAAPQVYRIPSAHVGRRSSRPPPTPTARMEVRRSTPASSPPSRAEVTGAAALAGPRKPTGRRRGPRRRAALPPPSPHLSSSDSGNPDATYRGDVIRMYVQRKAFAEIAEGQDRRRSPTVTLERLVKVLGWFELALNPSAVERVCGIPMQSAGEPRDISIDFNAFVKIMDSSLDCQHHSEGSRPSSEWASAPVANNEDPQFNAIVLALPPEAPARAFPAEPLIPGLTAAGTASLSSGSGPAPFTQAAPYTSSVRDSGGSIRSLWNVAFATSAAHRRSGSLSSVATTTASSAVSGASVPKSSVDTDDAYPLATHGSAVAALCRSIRQRLRQELRRSVSSGSDALPPPRESQGSGSKSGDGVAHKERDVSQHPPSTRTVLAASRWWRSPSPVSSSGVMMSSGDASAVGLVESDSLSSCHDSAGILSERLNGTKGNAQLACQTQREQAPSSPFVAHALPPPSHAYPLTTAPRDGRAQPGWGDGSDIASHRSSAAQRWRGRGPRLNSPPLSIPATARRRSPSTPAARRCRQQQASIHLLTSLSPYCSPGQYLRRPASHHRSRSAAPSTLSRLPRSSPLHSRDSQSVLCTLLSARLDSSTSLRSHNVSAERTWKHPKRDRPATAYIRPAAAPTYGVCAPHLSHPPFSPTIRSAPLPFRRGLLQACWDGAG